LSEVPAGEGHGIVDHDDQVFFAAGELLAHLGVAVFDQQPATPAGSGQYGVFEADQYAVPREAVPIQPGSTVDLVGRG
jgi:hypothetical protein